MKIEVQNFHLKIKFAAIEMSLSAVSVVTLLIFVVILVVVLLAMTAIWYD